MLRFPGVIAPFVVFAAVQFVMLLAFALFTISPISAFMVPVVAAVGGEQALHYPMHLILLPRMYHLMYLPMSIIVGFSLFGWAVSVMIGYYDREGVKIPNLVRRSAVSMIPSLVVIGLIYVGLVTAIQFLFSLAQPSGYFL